MAYILFYFLQTEKLPKINLVNVSKLQTSTIFFYYVSILDKPKPNFRHQETKLPNTILNRCINIFDIFEHNFNCIWDIQNMFSWQIKLWEVLHSVCTQTVQSGAMKVFICKYKLVYFCFSSLYMNLFTPVLYTKCLLWK